LRTGAGSRGAAMTAYSLVPIQNISDAMKVWQRLADLCPDAWFWHTGANMQFNFVAAQNGEVRNLSCFVMQDGQPVGLAPLMVTRTKIMDVEAWEASYYGGPLPWPAFGADLKDAAEAEQFVLSELEARAREAGAERIRLRLEPPSPAPNDHERLERAIGLKYLDSSYASHWIKLDQDTLANTRERYRRYVKKFAPAYDLSIATGNAVTAELEETYFKLHVKDAGGQFRSRESYRFQADLARQGEAFFVIARAKAKDVIAGALLVSAYKKAAYDNSVAVDPDFQSDYVSHLLKWKAIEELLRRGFESYELGPKSGLPGFMSLPSQKNLGISYFKDGWARGSTRQVFMAEKFFSARLLQAHMQAQADALQQYFGLK
jgi:GNAT acetyltransferase-like protein